MKRLRVLVCGGRDFEDRGWLNLVLTEMHEDNRPKEKIGVIIHGGALGADVLAGAWAAANGVIAEVYNANWETGVRAGPIRNSVMLIKGEPDIVVAFPGGKGTADMKTKARIHGVPVRCPIKERT